MAQDKDASVVVLAVSADGHLAELATVTDDAKTDHDAKAAQAAVMPDRLANQAILNRTRQAAAIPAAVAAGSKPRESDRLIRLELMQVGKLLDGSDC